MSIYTATNFFTTNNYYLDFLSYYVGWHIWWSINLNFVVGNYTSLYDCLFRVAIMARPVFYHPRSIRKGHIQRPRPSLVECRCPNPSLTMINSIKKVSSMCVLTLLWIINHLSIYACMHDHYHALVHVCMIQDFAICLHVCVHRGAQTSMFHLIVMTRSSSSPLFTY
jgi:hypothetical protein